MSPRTVQKHLEHIYRKLGVGTRTMAAVRALSAVELSLGGAPNGGTAPSASLGMTQPHTRPRL